MEMDSANLLGRDSKVCNGIITSIRLLLLGSGAFYLDCAITKCNFLDFQTLRVISM